VEAEESPLLETFPREWPVRTQQAEKKPSECCGNLWIMENSGGAVITCSSEVCE
jgi:hypothetical protein